MDDKKDKIILKQRRENLERYILIVLLIFISVGGFFSIFYSEKNILKRDDHAVFFVAVMLILWIVVVGAMIMQLSNKTHEIVYLSTPVVATLVFMYLLPGSNLAFLTAAMSFVILIALFSYKKRNIVAVLLAYFAIFFAHLQKGEEIYARLHVGFFYFGVFLTVSIGIVALLGLKIFLIYQEELNNKVEEFASQNVELAALNEEYQAAQETLYDQIDEINMLYNKSEKYIEKLDHIFNVSLDGLIEYNYANDEYMLSKNAQKILQKQTINAEEFIKALAKEEQESFRKIWVDMFRNDTISREVEVNYNVDGNKVLLKVILLKYNSNVDKMNYLVMVIKDITNERQQAERIHRLVYIDNLTGLDNKIAFSNKVETYLIENQGVSEVSIIYFDIAKFRYINSTFGYQFGNQLIASLGAGLKAYSDKVLSVARVSGDDFAIAVVKAEQLDEIISTLVTNFTTYYSDETDFRVNFNIGISQYQGGEINVEEMLKNAELAMYEAKEKGPNRPTYFKPNLSDEYHNQLLLSVRLEKAISHDEIYLNYQPVISVETGEVIAFEALVRWHSDRYGFVPPDEFIRLAESTGYITTLGSYILEQACHFSNRINGGNKRYMVTVNISAIQLYDIDFCENFMGILEKTVTPKEFIGIEITETAFIRNMKVAVDVIKKIREAGVKVYLDDFGTGFSSLNYLRTLPIDTLKIDKSFIDDVTIEARDNQLVEHIISLAHSLELTVVAEGVETKEQNDTLKMLNCNNIQGYYYSKPLSIEEAIAYIV